MIRLPHISNFTDFAPLAEHPSLGVRFVDRPEELGRPDLLILPGTKNTMGDLLWLRETGLEKEILSAARLDLPILGICGGYQMLGEEISDPAGVEHGGSLKGLGLLPCTTVFTPQKTRSRAQAVALCEPFAEVALEGYEIHMGVTETHGASPFCRMADGREAGAVAGTVFGTYLHGLFDNHLAVNSLAQWLGKRKGIAVEASLTEPRSIIRARRFDLLADVVRRNVDLEKIYQTMEATSHG